MHDGLLIVVLALILGLVTFVIAVLTMCWRILCGIGRGILLLFGAGRQSCPSTPRSAPEKVQNGDMVCPNPQCRKVDHRLAAYCSQCGTRLPRRFRATA